MGVKNTVAVVLGSAVLATSLFNMVDPTQNQTPEQVRQNQNQQQIENLSDAHERETDRVRDSGNSHLDSELSRRNVPGQHPPGAEPKVKPKVRVRVP